MSCWLGLPCPFYLTVQQSIYPTLWFACPNRTPPIQLLQQHHVESLANAKVNDISFFHLVMLRHNLPLINPCSLFSIMFLPFTCLDVVLGPAFARTHTVIFPQTEVRPTSPQFLKLFSSKNGLTLTFSQSSGPCPICHCHPEVMESSLLVMSGCSLSTLRATAESSFTV